MLGVTLCAVRGNSLRELCSTLAVGFLYLHNMIIKVIVTGLFLSSFLYPTVAPFGLLSFFVLFELFIFVSSIRLSSHEFKLNNGEILTDDERLVAKKYSLYFKYPYTAKLYSSNLSLIGIIGLILIPWLLFHSLWIPTAFFVINYFIAQKLSVKLNPRFYLHDAVERNNQLEHTLEMHLVDSICNKLPNNE